MLDSKKLGMVILKNMNVVICDDDHIWTEKLENQLRNYAAKKDFKLNVQMFYMASMLLRADLSNCNVLFLDIDMPGINGIEAAKQLRQTYPDLLLVFVTGWIDYAPAGYRVNAFRYL